MQPSTRLSLGAPLLLVAAIAILPPACAQGDQGSGLVGGSGSNNTSSSGQPAATGAGGGGGSPSSNAGGATGSGSAGATGAGGSSSAVGAGGATTATAATGTGAGPVSCDNNSGGCAGCQACAQAGACATQWKACQTAFNGQCVDFINCMNGCGGDQCCIANCNTLYLNGVTEFYAYVGCMCPVCANDCKGRSGC